MKTLVSASSLAFAVLVLPVLSAPVAVTVDFGKDGGAIRRALHSSGLGGQLVDPPAARLDDLTPLNLYGARTHDWALTNPGQRILDTHFIFPLLHADADDARSSLVPFAAGVSTPIYRRTGDRLAFTRRDPNAVAWLFTFE